MAKFRVAQKSWLASPYHMLFEEGAIVELPDGAPYSMNLVKLDEQGRDLPHDHEQEQRAQDESRARQHEATRGAVLAPAGEKPEEMI